MSDEQHPDVKALRILFGEPDPSTVQYANNVTIAHSDTEFVFTFYRILPPNTFGMTPDAIAAMETLDAHPVSRIIVPASKIKGFLTALSDNIGNYERKFGTLSDGDEENANENK